MENNIIVQNLRNPYTVALIFEGICFHIEQFKTYLHIIFTLQIQT